MRAIDTNVLVRLVMDDDERQTSAAENFIREGAWVSTLALAEAVWVLGDHYRLNAAQLVSAIEMLVNHRSIILEQPAIVEDALNVFRSRPTLGFSDCLILELARKAGHLPLGTLDRRLANANGARKI